MLFRSKKNLQMELERIEREKIRMLAEMEAVEEEEQQENERKIIKSIADLAESHASNETDTEEGNLKERRARDNDSDIEMKDGNNYVEEVAFVEVDSGNESDLELEGQKVVKTVSELILIVKTLLLTLGVLFNRRGRLLGLGGTFEQRLTRRKKSLVKKQGGSFLSLLLLS